MNEEKCRFEAGMTIVSVTAGIGKVISIMGGGSKPVNVKFKSHPGKEYFLTKEGKNMEEDPYPDIYLPGDIHPLFGVPVQIPKVKVQKDIEFFVNVYPEFTFTAPDFRKDNLDFAFHDTAEDACSNASRGLLATGKGSIHFEIMEEVKY